MKKITLLIMVTFFSALSYSQTTVDCTAGPVNNTGFCYGNNDTTSFVYTSNDGSPLAVTFNAGQVENNWDELIITNSDGTQLYSAYGNAGDLTGLSFESTGDTITIGITSDGSVNCAQNNFTPWDFTVSCVDTTQPPSCVAVISPAAGDIDVNEQADITWGTATGGPTGYKISIGTTPGGTDILAAFDVGLVNTYDPGALPFASTIYVTIIPYNVNGDTLGCTESSFTTRPDPNVIVDCSLGTPLNVTGFCYDNNNTDVFDYASSDGNSILVVTFNSGNVENNWDELIILDSDGVTELYNGYGNAGDLAGLTVTSTGTSLSITVTSDGSISCLNSTGINPWDYTISCMDPPTCPAPTALASANVTDSSADISWLAGAAETTWEIVVQTAGTGVPTGAGTVTTTNAPYAATALNPSTAYEVYVRADCGAVDGLSEWVGPINFSTLNVPPPPPVGVTCAAGASSFIFSEDFEMEPPSGWTGTGFSTNNGNWDITAGGGNSGGTGPSASFSGGMHMEYEASGNSTTIASAISPAVDLSSALDGAELSFYMHAFGDDIGTLNVNVGTSPTGPFTNVYSWIGDLQLTDTEAWVPIGVNLDAYLGQVIYLEFSYGGAGSGFEGDMSIDLVRVESCGAFCIAPSSLAAANVTDTTADISWTPNNGETQWEIVVQPAGTGTPTGAGTSTTTNAPYAATALTPTTAYEVYVRADCGVNGFSTWTGPVNFTTENAPPPPPVGVTCVTAGIPFATLAEDFEVEPPFGWTGTGFSTNNGDWDITAGGANSGGTGPSASFSGGMHMEYEASGNSTTIASAISPAVDLTTGLDGAELSFYMHAFGDDIGTLNVNVGTSPTGPFTNVYTWIGDLQTADTEAWVPIGVNLDAYLGQTIYIEFSYGGTGTGFEGDMSIDLVEVQTCSTAVPSCVSLISPLDGATAVEINQDITWSTAAGSPGGYIVSVGTTPGGTDIVNGVDVGNVNTLPLATNYDTTYYVTILAYNGNGLATGCTEESFTTRPDPNQVFNIVCANGPITVNHCYTNNDDNSFLFTSDTGFPIQLTFTSGMITDDDDIINFYSGSDNTGDLIFSGNNAGDLAGLVITSSGGNLFMELITDGFLSCATGDGTQWQWTAECLTCFSPTATYTVVEDCSMGDQFLVDVEILTTGDAASITISDDFGSASQVVTDAGVYTFGPYPNTTPIVFTVADTDDTNCILTSDPQTQAFCPDQACNVINAGYDQLQTCNDPSTDLSATFMTSSITSDTSTYTISDLQCPPDNLTGLPTSITADDRWSSVINLGFNFDYFGTTYTQVIIGANGLLSFDTGDAGLFCPWNINPADLIPSGNIPTNAIHGAWHDIDPGVPGNHYIEYAVVGTAPSRQFKVTFFEIPHFSGACNNLLTTQQIILYESSNVIDVVILEKPICPTWIQGLATLGIQNDTGTVGYAPPGRNTGTWAVTQQELWRFVPDGNPNYTFEWLDEDGNVISNDTDITVTPTETTTYTASITYALADGSLATITDDVVVTVETNPLIVPVGPLEVCDDDYDGITEFDLTVLEADILAGAGQTDVSVSYYETLADADAGTNMLADPTTYVNTTPNLETVYYRVENNTTGCFATSSFDLSVLAIIDPSNIGIEGECINDEFTITVSPLNNSYDPALVTYEWSGGFSTDNTGSQFIATDDGEYSVAITTPDGCVSMQTFSVVNSMCSFPQGISPNGDGLNDDWNLRAFRVNEVEIFNSHGRSVFKKLNYTNEWRGQSNDDEALPVGTYFYVLRLENGEAKNGWVYLNK